MDFELLEVIFKIGQLFAVTPSISRSQSRNLSNKFWALTVTIIYTCFKVYSLVQKKFYRRHNFFTGTVYFLVDTTLYLLNIYVILIYNFCKQEKWKRLLSALKDTSDLCSGKSWRWCYGLLFAAHFMYLVSVTYFLYFWYSPSFLRRHFVRQVESYIQFFYSCLLCCILYMLSQRYQSIHDHLSKKENTVFDRTRLKRFGVAMYHQQRAVKIFNDLLGFPVALIIANCVFHTLGDLNFVIYHARSVQEVLTYSLVLLPCLVRCHKF